MNSAVVKTWLNDSVTIHIVGELVKKREKIERSLKEGELTSLEEVKLLQRELKLINQYIEYPRKLLETCEKTEANVIRGENLIS